MDEKNKEKVKEILGRFQKEMAELEKEQNKILDEFAADCEKGKLSDIRSKLE